jgi:hypothetical protein
MAKKTRKRKRAVKAIEKAVRKAVKRGVTGDIVEAAVEHAMLKVGNQRVAEKKSKSGPGKKVDATESRGEEIRHQQKTGLGD